MYVILMYNTPLSIADQAISKSRDVEPHRDPEKQLKRILRVGNKLQHGSVLEHLVYTFEIRRVSRALLQELARHRMASLTVKSTRYTLQELKKEKPFIYPDILSRARNYLVATGAMIETEASIRQLETLRKYIVEGGHNDRAKYLLPESYMTEMLWTINARSLQNFLKLRSAPSAFEEIRELANHVYHALPDEHKPIFKEFMYERADNTKEHY